MSAGDGTLRPRSALVVDDDDFVRLVVVQMLGRIGYSGAREAENGRIAADLLRAGLAPELIICDLMMPTSDGLELMHEIRQLCPDSRVVLMSSADPRVLRTAHEVAQARGLQVLGVLNKPVARAALLALLEQAPRPRATPAAASPQAPIGVEELQAALRQREFRIVVQPQLCLRTGRLVGAEALVRWHSPAHGLVPPDRFLPVLTQAGLMGELTEFVMAAAIEACGRWRLQGLDTRVAINFATETLLDRRLPGRLAELATAAGLPVARIVAEITESGALQDCGDPLEVMTRLRLRDVELSIDDFGTGYSTLERLQRLPFTEFKIDRRFVATAVADEQSRHIVESNIHLAHSLGLHTVAEGVETAEDLALMTHLGCDTAQGYYIARPMAADLLPAWSVDHRHPACADRDPPCPHLHACKLAQG